MSVDGHSWTAREFGAPTEQLRFEPRSWEQPADGAVLIEVAAVGVGLPDLLMTQGSYPLVRRPPISPGQEACGTVVALNEGSRFAVGDRVFGPTHFYAGSGGFATHTYLTERTATLVPEAMSDEQAAGFYIGFRTAHAALVTRGQLLAEESVLVLGGSGGSGSTAILLAKALGARVVAMASTEAKRQFCLDLGADEVVPRDAAALASLTSGRGFDVVYDPVGGEIGTAAVAATARYGRFIPVGFASGSWAAIDPAQLVTRNISVVGVLAAGFEPDEEQRHMAELLALAADGLLSTPIAEVLPLDQAPAAIASLGTSVPPGKLIVSAVSPSSVSPNSRQR